MPRRSLRPVALALTLALLAATGTAAAQVAGTLILNPSSGPAGSSVSASGTFAGACGVRLFWDSVGGTVLAEAAAGRDGTYAAAFVVPAGAGAGGHVVHAVGLVPDRDFLCTLQTSTVVSQGFQVTAADTGLSATLALVSPEAGPGEGVILDAGGSTGQIAAFEFDLDGNGSYETSCPGPRAAAVHNQRGSQPIGLRVVAADGQEAFDEVVLEVTGPLVPPPPDPDGGRAASPFEQSSIVGSCVDESGVDFDAVVQSWYCPQTVIVGVAEATFRKWGINGADQDACFERKEIKLPVLGFDFVTTSFIASKPSTAPGPFRQNPVLINGLEFAHPESNTAWYYNDIGINETLQFLYSSGKKQTVEYFEWQIAVQSQGHRTSFSSKPFLWPDAWDVSTPRVMGTFAMGADAKKPIWVNDEFLGLDTAEKQTAIAFTAGHLAKLTVHVSPPFQEFAGVSLPTSAVPIFTENNGGHPFAFPSGAQAALRRSSAAPPEFELEFTGIKLGMFTMDASLSYQEEGGDDVWAGGMVLFFPGGESVGGTLVIRNGDFESASFAYHPGPPGIGPIGCCVWIYDLFGGLTTTSVSAGANFGIGPEIPVIEVPPAAVTGEATIFYGDPWAFALDVSNLEIVGIGVNASAEVVISSNGFLAQAFMDEDWGPLELQSNLTAKLGKSTWFAGGGASVCVDLEVLEGCGGGYAGIGKDGIAGCAKIPYLPDGGVALHWEFFTGDLLAWDLWWGCGFGDVQSAASAPELARSRARSGGLARVPVRIGAGASSVLFAIEGEGGPPKVELNGPDGIVIASDPGGPLASGPGWSLVELPHDDTTYVTLEDPDAGAWQVDEVAGSAPITSIGLAEGLPNRVARANVSGDGRNRTLHYDIADVEGVAVTFLERSGDPDSADPGGFVDRIIGTVRGGEGTLRFTPAEASSRDRVIEAQILVDGVPVETETVASFTAPRLRPLPAPSLEAVRSGRGLLLTWNKVSGAIGYRLVIDRSDGPTEVLDVDGLRVRVGQITARTRTGVTIQAFSEAGYFGRVGRAMVA